MIKQRSYEYAFTNKLLCTRHHHQLIRLMFKSASKSNSTWSLVITRNLKKEDGKRKKEKKYKRRNLFTQKEDGKKTQKKKKQATTKIWRLEVRKLVLLACVCAYVCVMGEEDGRRRWQRHRQQKNNVRSIPDSYLLRYISADGSSPVTHDLLRCSSFVTSVS